MGIKVMVAFSNMLFSSGICNLLDGTRDISVVSVLKSDEVYDPEKLGSSDCEVVITDFTSLYNTFPGLEKADKRPAFILVDTNCGEDNITTAVLRKKLNGVVPCDADTEHLKKAIKAVAEGQIWINNETVKNLINGINAIGPAKTSILTNREKEVVALTGEGYRNKEIAQRLNIGEPTVKTHLHNIFQKLNIKTRSELITYAIKSEEMRMRKGS